MNTGIVKFYNEAKGYGFITDEQNNTEYFVHASGLKQPVKNDDKVMFEVGEGKKGPMAVNVTIA